jgi:hypothetical protein
LKIKTIILAIIIVNVLLSLSGCTNNNTSNDLNWLEKYTPVHGIGTGSDDFWINYPLENPSSSQSVDHLDWVINSLNEGCVLFVVHKTGCKYCKAQADRVIAIADKYEDQLEFYDLDIPLGGDVERMAYDAYLYDPDGPPGYIALTGVFTLVEDNMEIKCGWHSWELDVEDSVMESWIKDAIYYYTLNNKG